LKTLSTINGGREVNTQKREVRIGNRINICRNEMRIFRLEFEPSTYAKRKETICEWNNKRRKKEANLETGLFAACNPNQRAKQHGLTSVQHTLTTCESEGEE
jgi:hypothetical protein